MSKDEREMDALAEQDSRGRSIAHASRAIGVSQFRGEFLWARILARLGDQAR